MDCGGRHYNDWNWDTYWCKGDSPEGSASLRSWNGTRLDSTLGNGQSVLPEEAQLVPVAALEGDPSSHDAEEPAPAQAQGIAPLEDGPLAVLEEVLHEAHHLCGGELPREHGADRLPAHDRRFRHLVVHRVRVVHRGHGVGVGAVEGLDPGGHEGLRRHRTVSGWPSRRGGWFGLSMSDTMSHRPPAPRRRVSTNLPASGS